MGTFRISMLSIQSQSGTYSNNGATPVATLLEILNLYPGVDPATKSWKADSSGSVVCLPNSSGIYLDGSLTPVNEAGLPVGFHPLAALVNVEFSTSGDNSASWQIRRGAALSAVGAFTLAFPDPVTINNILATTVGFDQIFTATSHLVIRSLQILGTYDIQSWSFANPNPITPTGTVKVASNGTTPNLLDVLDFHLLFTDINGVDQDITVPSTDFFTWTTITLWFLLPTAARNHVGPITVNGTFFTGSVLLGILYVLVTDGSGIYRIVSGKTNDTLYIDSSVGNTTVDVKIPNPFLETGFIGG